MIYFLFIVIVLLCAIIVALTIGFRKATREHSVKVDELHRVILHLSEHSQEQLERLKLSDALREKLAMAREAIDKELVEMQFDFVEKLSKNNLIE